MDQGAQPIIKLENVWKIYRLGKAEVQSLRGVNLEIMPGSLITLMGPSGSGKSTLLNLIGLLDVPTKGTVYLKGKDVTKLAESELSVLRGRSIGFVFQEFHLLAYLKAWENVEIPMIFQGVSKARREMRSKELLALVGLEARVDHQLSELSIGERQRVAIARAFVNDPEMVIADEPTGNLDSINGKKIMEILINFQNKNGKTLMIVTHDPNIGAYGRQRIFIKDGQIVDEVSAFGRKLI
ncbi:MAG TPA: ABC transporter ATP-binding protein [Candidatus Paceibacterota bacterium]|nr:ABC transporter ATP-binding protein [Candidatus Pacearchaeota archaeon]HRZ50543.1 ABC transporter ATP-binding protein [Candidatus Paceibacterota bacterium]HSA36264.1 ABC transporter ATP-binding protein [Candidatus Paceibacterota bacterium]